ncbi:MAG: restriction endonuclease subunit R [Prochlorotrichaceae cyanobacterium]
MVVLNARKLTRGDVHRLLGLDLRLNGSFSSLLTLDPLTEEERQELQQIQQEFLFYWQDSKISEGQVRFLSVAPLLRLAGFNQAPIRLEIEENIDRFYIEDGDTYITGRFDLIAVHRERSEASVTPLWVLVVESKNSEASSSAGVAQMLTYAYSSLEHQPAVWGLVTNGETYQFFYLQQGSPATYQFMPPLNLFGDDLATQLLQVLKAIRIWQPIAS